MNVMSQILKIAEDIHSHIEMPEISDPYLRTVWVMGRNAGANKARNHLRHHLTNKFPVLTKAPVAIRKEMGQTAADVWLNAHNAALDYVQRKVNVLLFYMSAGQIIATR